MRVYRSVEELVGKTPLLELSRLKKQLRLQARIFAKLEYFNPIGSVKDRVAKAMLDEGERSGKLEKGSVIIEPTSGNTGIALAAFGAARGYRVVIVMPENMSQERQRLIKAYGAELVLTNAKEGMQGAIERAKQLKKEIKNSFIPDQFSNFSNPQAHRATTGAEIFKDMDGKVDIFVAGVGTGGTLTGVGEYLKEKNPAVQVIAVEPKSSAFLSKGEVGLHTIQGIGAGFAPPILNREVYDEIISVSNEDAFTYLRLVAETEGVFLGISAGAALCAAVELAKRKENKRKNVVVIFPDGGDRYLSAQVFNSSKS